MVVVQAVSWAEQVAPERAEHTLAGHTPAGHTLAGRTPAGHTLVGHVWTDRAVECRGGAPVNEAVSRESRSTLSLTSTRTPLSQVEIWYYKLITLWSLDMTK